MRSESNMTAQRSAAGETLISLLVATTIMALVAAGIMGLMSINTRELVTTFNRADNLTAARVAMDKIGRVVRQARNLGDIQGSVMPISDPYAQLPAGPSVAHPGLTSSNNANIDQIEAGTYANISAGFPSSGDIFWYPSSTQYVSPAGGWPWNGQALRLGTPPDGNPSTSTLILQMQCFDANGFPRCIPSAYSGGATDIPALDTYVFNVLPDTANTNPGPFQWYKLEMAVFPAGGTSHSVGITNVPPGLIPGTPVTMLTNIVGPLDPTTHAPANFQFVCTQAGLGQNNMAFTDFTAGNGNESLLLNFRGVICNFQVMQLDSTGKPMSCIARSEFFTRNNCNATMIGQ